RYHGSGIGLLSRVVVIASGFTSAAELQDAATFFRAHRVPGTERAIKKSLEMIRSNIAWRERARGELQDYFAEASVET
ncbi:MAG: hypothetical protein HY648_00660, partial [Acidobacteria bacterium]|nr:hypothetical protein [Acidobacteriota bacterium]